MSSATAFGKCSNLTPCTLGVNYQSSAPTLTSNRICGHNVTLCTLGVNYQSSAPTLTSNRLCFSLTICKPGELTITEATLTSDRKCSSGTITNHADSISAGGIAGIIISIIAMGAMLFFLGRRLGMKDQRRIEEAEMEVLVARAESEESQAAVQRIRAAWEIVSDDVQMLAKLAEGTFGVVWKGRWGNQTVAIKVLKTPLDQDADGVENSGTEDFQKECETLQTIKHPNLIVFFGAGINDDGTAFMVTEFMAGGSLRTALQNRLVRLDWSTRVKIARHVAAGMRHLHKLSIVHRDLKSDNCLLDSEYNAKVADFGTSKTLFDGRKEVNTAAAANVDGSASMTKAVGTQLWMAPEVFVGKSDYGPEIDVYSFGVIMWELVTRKTPWCELDAETYIDQFRKLDAALLEGRRPSVPGGFEDEHPVYNSTMQLCWSTDPKSRPSFDAVVFMLKTVPVPAVAVQGKRVSFDDEGERAGSPQRQNAWRFATVSGAALQVGEKEPKSGADIYE